MNVYRFNSTEETNLFAPFTINEIEYRLATIMLGDDTYSKDVYNAGGGPNPRRVLSIVHMLGNGKKPVDIS